jgi:glutamate formiminotransferase
LATRKSTRRMAKPSAAPAAPGPESVETAAGYISDARAQLLIYSAALKTSNCELAKAIGERLNFFRLCNDLDAAREMLVGTQRAAQS